MEGIVAVSIPIVAILVFGSPLYLNRLLSFIVEISHRRGASAKEIEGLRQELATLKGDYQQLKADHNDMLLGLNATVHRLEARLDRQVGIDVPPPGTEQAPPPPARRQL